MSQTSNSHPKLTRFALLSVAVALFTIIFKSIAYFITGSVGLLSDALESIVNLVGALMALAMLAIAARPADEKHTYGHSKAEYFSSGVEGALILIAAGSIIYTAVNRLINPQPLEKIGVGLIVSVIASLANLVTSLILQRTGKKYNSISLISNGKHLMTDVWTSGGVLLGVGAVAIVHWQPLDAIVAIVVAANIIWTGVGIVRKSVAGLMDSALSDEERTKIENIFEQHQPAGVTFHSLRTRQSGAVKFISVHISVPGDWTVEHGHQLVTQIENEILTVLPSSAVFTHLEPQNKSEAHHESILGEFEYK